MSKQDRQGVRTPADIERKYDLGKDYSEIQKLATDAKNAADAASRTASSAKQTADTTAQQFETMGEAVSEMDERVTELENAAPNGGGVSFTTDETLSLTDGVLSVNRADSVQADNTLPITSAAVYVEIGNIDVLLQTI